MLSLQVLTNSTGQMGRVANYYEDGADDYYASEGDAAQWQGKGAKMLGLSGEVDKEAFRKLLAGDVNGQQMRQSTRSDYKNRIGIDLTFSAPKSVSMQALIHGDPVLVRAHDEAVRRTLEHVERMAQAKIKVMGKSRIEDTGNLIIAKFRHETSREQDPQLHTHAVVMNLTRRADGSWRALTNDEIVKSVKYLGAVYRAELAMELSRAGYSLRHARDGMFELAHISRDQIEAFSGRAKTIEATLAAAGLTRETASTAQIFHATLSTRQKKKKLDRQALHNTWKQASAQLGIAYAATSQMPRLSPVASAIVHAPRHQAADRALRFAINHTTERAAIVGEAELFDVAVKHAMQRANLRDIRAAADRLVGAGYLLREDRLYVPAGQMRDAPKSRHTWIEELRAKGIPAAAKRVDDAIAVGGLVRVEPRYSTQTARDREVSILKLEREGRGALAPVMAADRARARLAASSLNAGQRAAVELVVSSPHRIVGVQGFAGTGKSHMLAQAKALLAAEGYEMQALAPYGSQVKALRELKTPARTVASFLRAKDKLIDAQTVLVLDEAGVVPARQMNQVLRIAAEKGARVVLVGDRMQTKAIEAGRPFDQLLHSGMAVASMTEIRRQHDPDLRHAVELAAHAKPRQSLAYVTAIHEVPDAPARHRDIAQSFASRAPDERAATLIVTGVNEARREINLEVRKLLDLAGKGREYDTLIRRDTTQAERRHARYYRIGDVVQPERDYAKLGLDRGHTYRVIDTGPKNELRVQSIDDLHEVTFSPMQAKLSVYQPERSELSVGDVVRVTRNDAKLDLANGDRFTVKAVARDRVTISDGKRQVELPADHPLHVDHAYATTVHSAQGLTCNRVLIEADTQSRTTASDVFYVAVSRARHEAIVYTNDRSKLPDAVTRENHKHAALELLRREPVGPVYKQAQGRP